MISKDDWAEWRSNSVTKAFMEACQERIQDAQEDLGRTAGLDQQMDNFLRGLVHAYKEVQEFSIEFEGEDS